MNNEPLKSMVFRIPAKLKVDFRVVLLKHECDIQHALEAFAETVVAFDRGEKCPDPIRTILKRAHTLTHGVER